MGLLNITAVYGLDIKKVASTNGDEYAGTCPKCGGNDRFRVWPNHPDCNGGRYWCRRCGIHGDAIQFLREFQKLSYYEACQEIGIEPTRKNHLLKSKNRQSRQPREIELPSLSWQQKAVKFIDNCHNTLICNPKYLAIAYDRGLTKETIMNHHIGFNLKERFEKRDSWGLNTEINLKTGKEKKVWLPKGLVIPMFDGEIVKYIKIRRTNYKEGDDFAKYAAVTGSSVFPTPLSNNLQNPTIIVEGEFDGLILMQEAGDLVNVLILGSVSVKPDKRTNVFLKSSPFILISLDFDESGAREWIWWKKNYERVERFPTPFGKDPGEYMNKGGNIRLWILSAIPRNFLPAEYTNVIENKLPLEIIFWPSEWQERYEERASIMEYDGGLSRCDAEKQSEEIQRKSFMLQNILNLSI